MLYRLSYMGPLMSSLHPFSLALQGEGGATAPGEVGENSTNLPILFGAGNGTRTRDPELGRLALYQLSYSRSPAELCNSSRISPPACPDTTLCMVERGGFEPPKAFAVRFTV